MELWIVLWAPQSCFQQNRLLCISFIVLLSQTWFPWSLRLIKHFLFRFIFYLAALGLTCSIQDLPDSLWHAGPFRSVQFSSVSQLCPTLCDLMNCNTPGLPVHHQLLEFTHIHRVGDAIQPSHSLSSLLLLPPIPPSIRVFSKESTLHMKWPKYWSFSFSIIPSKEILGINNLKSYFINEIIK